MASDESKIHIDSTWQTHFTQVFVRSAVLLQLKHPIGLTYMGDAKRDQILNSEVSSQFEGNYSNTFLRHANTWSQLQLPINFV